MSKALLIANRNSRQGGDERLATLVTRLTQGGLQIIKYMPEDRDDAARAVRQHQHEVDRVIVSGGDGTINSVAGALHETGLPLAILPMGTANDLARTLSIPDDPEAACDIILGNHQTTIDLGLVNGFYFFNVANIGLGTKITRELTPEVKKRFGVLSYLKAFFSAVKRNRRFRVHLEIDGRIYKKKSIQLAIGNGRYYGGGNVIEEEASIDDGLLSLYSIEPLTIWELITLAPLLREGKHNHIDRVFNANGKRIVLKTSRRKSIHADGEPMTETPAVFEVIEKALKVIVPVQPQKEME